MIKKCTIITKFRHLDYDSELGFTGLLGEKLTSNDFECRGRIDRQFGKNKSAQKFELKLVDVDSQIKLLDTSSNVHLITQQLKNRDHGALLVNSRINTEPAEPISLTCVAQVACRDVLYDIRFVIDDQPTDAYHALDIYVPHCDRSDSLVQVVTASRTMVIDKWTEASWNGTSIRCEIHYGVGTGTTSFSSLTYKFIIASLFVFLFCILKIEF